MSSWVEELGETADEVAMNLYRAGARGIPSDCKHCVIAMYYKIRRPNGFGGLEVNYRKRTVGGEKMLFAHMTFNDNQIIDPVCTTAVANFLYRFDQGKYPFLHAKAIPDKADVLASLTPEQRISLSR